MMQWHSLNELLKGFENSMIEVNTVELEKAKFEANKLTIRIAFANIRSALKRAKSMGKHHNWIREYDEHPLAAVTQNYHYIIDKESSNNDADFLSMIVWYDHIAKHINVFCDDNKIAGNDASEYWLEKFLWIRADVADFDKLN